MKTPYQVLGVSENASDREVREAYHKILKTCESESTVGNPLAHLAKEKIEDATAAYESIMRGRSSGGQKSGFLDVRRLINSGRNDDAEQILDGTPYPQRDAEWYFLKGTVQYGRGWLDDAYDNFVRATELNPTNAEYKAAFSQLQWQRQTGRTASQTAARGFNTGQPTGTQCSVCEICAAGMCLNMCCKCC